MSQTDEGSSASTPTWALERAREIARERQEREHDRHDEYDDPEQGGEG
jgi:hypothetical protein